MSKFRMEPASQPCQRRTAKYVMADSWSPVSSERCTPVSACTRASTAAPFADSRIAEVQNEIMSSARCSSANAAASRTKSTSSRCPSSVIAPSASW